MSSPWFVAGPAAGHPLEVENCKPRGGAPSRGKESWKPLPWWSCPHALLGSPVCPYDPICRARGKPRGVCSALPGSPQGAGSTLAAITQGPPCHPGSGRLRWSSSPGARKSARSPQGEGSRWGHHHLGAPGSPKGAVIRVGTTSPRGPVSHARRRRHPHNQGTRGRGRSHHHRACRTPRERTTAWADLHLGPGEKGDLDQRPASTRKRAPDRMSPSRAPRPAQGGHSGNQTRNRNRSNP